MEYITLANGVKMPLLGYGVYQVDPAECERCVTDAIAVGYRSIDTAQAYHNEEGVGNAVRKSGLPREDWERYLDSREEITPEDRLVLTQCMRRLNDQERQALSVYYVSDVVYEFTKTASIFLGENVDDITIRIDIEHY